MTTVYIAEKPSLGRAIAAALPGLQRKRDGFIELANGDVVTWCFGHLLEQVDPHVYDARFKHWSLGHLPIIPGKWLLAPRPKARAQIAVIRRLLSQASLVVHAGDPDREGQLLVDEVIDHLQFPAAKRAQIRRLLIRDLNQDAVKRSLETMRLNTEFAPLSTSALARSRADWLFGINMTRAYTLLGQKAGHKGVLSVGRVQTPVLGLVVRRDAEIANFVSKTFYQVHALIPYEGKDIKALWKPSDACAPFQDEEGRVIHRPLAENVCSRIQGQPATVQLAEHKESRQAAPLPYSLSALQIDAAKRYGLSAADVLEACQTLYEKHQAITYPRSDCRYLPAEHHQQAGAVCKAVVANVPPLSHAVQSATLSIRSKAWNDKKVGAHHAIIPTPRELGPGALQGNEQRVYELVARQYLMQFFPPALYAKGKLEFAIGTGAFVATGTQLLSPGWRALLFGEKAKSKREDAQAHVPDLKVGTVLTCREGLLSDRQTEAPKAFTDATLLEAMTGIGRFVSDAALKKILRETDGLGTEATRASIIETLFRRTFLARKGKSIHATAVGRSLIEALPPSATYPDMTANWERRLRNMASREDAYQPFMRELEAGLSTMLEGPVRGEVPACLRSAIVTQASELPAHKRTK